MNKNKTVIWITGLSGSGKSALAYALEKELSLKNQDSFVLDGDTLRGGLCSDLGFSELDRSENIRRAAHVIKLLLHKNQLVIAAFISPFERDRLMAKEILNSSRFIEIYMDCPLQVCEQRDPKGLYALARQGQLTQFTGISSPYEPPQKPDLTFRSDTISIHDEVVRVIQKLKENS